MLKLAAIVMLSICSVCRAERIDLYVMAGQSNMYGIVGRNEIPSDLSAPQDIPFKFSMQYVPTIKFISDGFIDLQPLSNFGSQYFLSTYASELSFGRELRQRSNKKIAILKVCANATTLAVDWNPATPAGLYHRLTNATIEALLELAGLGYEPSVKGFVWVQGENDAQTQENAQNYEHNLGNFLDTLRTEEWFSAAAPIVVNQLHLATNIEHSGTVRSAQAAVVAARTDNVYLLNNDDLALYVDEIHYTGAMQIEVGRRLAEYFIVVVPEPSTHQIALVALGVLGFCTLPGRTGRHHFRSVTITANRTLCSP